MADQVAILLETYLGRRDALKRYFALRLRSEAAAEDLVQDIYFKLQTLEPDRPVSAPAAYLYRLGTNLMLDRLKAEQRAGRRDAAWLDVTAERLGGEDVADEPSAEQAVASRQRLERMLAAVEELTPPVRRAFRLHKLEGRSHAETAAAMGVSKSAVEKHISTALKHLMKRVGP